MFQIEALRPGDWAAAMQVALARVPDPERESRVRHAIHLLAAGDLDPRGIWVARIGEVIEGVQVCVPLAGNACFFWLPVRPGTCADPLVQACLLWAESIGCKLAQAVAGPNEGERAAILIRNGFDAVTQLCQLEHDLCWPIRKPSCSARFDVFRPSLEAEFADTLERTYVGTLDCPELNGSRTIDEILAGHRGQGKFNPDFWWLVRMEDQAVGVVMLAEMLDGVTWELAYLGVVPAFRRRGLARAMMLHVLDAVRDQPATRLTLAVDVRNTPALRLYQGLGFVETERSEVLLFFFPSGRPELCQPAKI